MNDAICVVNDVLAEITPAAFMCIDSQTVLIFASQSIFIMYSVAHG